MTTDNALDALKTDLSQLIHSGIFSPEAVPTRDRNIAEIFLQALDFATAPTTTIANYLNSPIKELVGFVDEVGHRYNRALGGSKYDPVVRWNSSHKDGSPQFGDVVLGATDDAVLVDVHKHLLGPMFIPPQGSSRYPIQKIGGIIADTDVAPERVMVPLHHLYKMARLAFLHSRHARVNVVLDCKSMVPAVAEIFLCVGIVGPQGPLPMVNVKPGVFDGLFQQNQEFLQYINTMMENSGDRDRIRRIGQKRSGRDLG